MSVGANEHFVVPSTGISEGHLPAKRKLLKCAFKLTFMEILAAVFLLEVVDAPTLNIIGK